MLKVILILVISIGVFSVGLETAHQSVKQSVQTSTQKHLDEIDRIS